MTDAPGTPLRRWAFTLSAPIVAGTLLLGACSKKEETPPNNNSTTTTTAKSSTGGTSGGSTSGTKGTGGTTGTAKPAGASLDTAVWYDGFKYTLGGVTYDSTERTLTIETQIENQLTSNNTPFTNVSLEADGTQIAEGGIDDTKEVIAKSKANGKFVIRSLPKDYDPSKTTLVFGSGADQQARVPLSGDGKVVTLKPIDQDFKGEIKIGQVTYNVKNVQVRYDNVPHDGNEAKSGKAFLVLTGDLKNSSDSMAFVTPNNWVLTPPDGTKSTPDNNGPDDPQATKTVENYYVIYKIDAKDGKFAGDYSLTITEDFGADGADVTTDPVKITVKDSSSSSSTGTTTK